MASTLASASLPAPMVTDLEQAFNEFPHTPHADAPSMFIGANLSKGGPCVDPELRRRKSTLLTGTYATVAVCLKYSAAAKALVIDDEQVVTAFDAGLTGDGKTAGYSGIGDGTLTERETDCFLNGCPVPSSDEAFIALAINANPELPFTVTGDASHTPVYGIYGALRNRIALAVCETHNMQLSHPSSDNEEYRLGLIYFHPSQVGMADATGVTNGAPEPGRFMQLRVPSVSSGGSNDAAKFTIKVAAFRAGQIPVDDATAEALGLTDLMAIYQPIKLFVTGFEVPRQTIADHQRAKRDQAQAQGG